MRGKGKTMRNEPREGPRFPATCARCGGRIDEPVSFCPHCGTHARLALGGEQPAAREASSKDAGADMPLGEALWASRPRPLFAADFDSSYRDMHPPMSGGGRQWGLKGGTALTLLAFVVLYGGAVLLHRHDNASTQTQQTTQRMSEGSVQAGKGGGSAEATDRRDAEARRAQAGPAVAAATPAPAAPAPGAKPSGAPNTAANSAAPVPPPAVNAPSAPQPSQQTLAKQAEAVPAPQQAAPSSPRVPEQAPAKPAAPAPSVASVEPSASDLTGFSVTQPGPSSDQRSSHSSAAVAPVVVPPSAQSAGQSKNAAARQSRQTLAAARAPSAASPSAKEEPHSERRQASVAHSIAVAQENLAKNNLSAARRAIAAAQAAQPDNSDAFMLQRDLVSREQARDAALVAARTCLVEQRWTCAWHNAGNALSIDASSGEARALVNRAMIESNAAGRPEPAQPAVPMLVEPGRPPAPAAGGPPVQSAQTRPAAPATAAQMPPILGSSATPTTAGPIAPTQTRPATPASNQPDVPMLTQ